MVQLFLVALWFSVFALQQSPKRLKVELEKTELHAFISEVTGNNSLSNVYADIKVIISHVCIPLCMHAHSLL